MRTSASARLGAPPAPEGRGRSFPWAGSLHLPTIVLALASLVGQVAPMPVAAQDETEDPTLDPDEAVRLVGEIVDRSGGEAVPTATVVLAGFGPEGPPVWSGTTDSSGRFATELVPPGAYHLRIEVVGFTPVSDLLVVPEPGTIDVRVEMAGVDYEIDPIVVTARRRSRLEEAGFYQRRQSGAGTFLTRDDILEANPIQFSDLFRTVPGVRVTPGGIGSGGRILLRRGCVPDIFLDGARMAPPVDTSVLPSPLDLDAVEVHQGAVVPATVAGRSGCGSVVLWTRDPSGGPVGSLSTTLKVLGGAVLVVLAVLFAR